MEKIRNYNKLNLLDSSRKSEGQFPHDNEAEEILIGALISENNCVELIICI